MLFCITTCKVYLSHSPVPPYLHAASYMQTHYVPHLKEVRLGPQVNTTPFYQGTDIVITNLLVKTVSKNYQQF